MVVYHQPETIEEAVAVLDQPAGAAQLYAGGTDLIPRWSRELAPMPDTLVDLKRVAELRGVSTSNGEIRIGSCTIMSDLERDATLRESAPVLSRAASLVACTQIRNRATIGGNLCNASPAADTAVPLILLDAVLDVSSGASRRAIPIGEFFVGPGSTSLKSGELLTNIRFPRVLPGTFTAWQKFGTRPSMEIAVASVGVLLKIESGTIVHARVGYGSVAPVPKRGCAAEKELLGREFNAQVIDDCVAAACDEIQPISDVRASAEYRRELVGVMLRRMLSRAESGQ